ncbi:FecCD family ABC transporter permease [Pseudooceanicola aestuarii]|uniref:FecCD family ABC transporter permease n=1 Tax=Pseudooceanicola aestuarii TaxID=2697319 RepID=UPI0013D4C7D6|nr:iron ABC transporter permease [Pseudooceanicola aestuarii]
MANRPGTAWGSAAAGPESRGRRRRRGRGPWVAGLALVVLAAACALSVIHGARVVGWDDIAAGLSGQIDSVAQAAVAQRLPRTVLGILAGAALAVSGAVMQGVTRNPLADPGILGVNAGASLAVVIGIAWFSVEAAQSFIWLGIGGAGLAAVFVYAVGTLGPGGASPLKLALAGAATAIALSSVTMAIVLPRQDIAEAVQAWHIGGIGGATWPTLRLVAPYLLAGFAGALLLGGRLNALALGDELAAGLGERVAWARAGAALVAVTLAGATTAICGPIAFVGLVVPHVCRLLGGVDHRRLLPLSAATGAAFLLVSDVLGRIIARPTEAQVGIVTALVGAPFFIWVVRRQKVRNL